MPSEILKNQQGRYDIVGISDEFGKNGQQLSGIAGCGSIDGWILNQLGYAFAVQDQGETIVLNWKSAKHWLDRHSDLDTSDAQLSSVVRQIRRSVEPMLKLKIHQNEQGRCDIDTIPDSYQKGTEQLSGIVDYGSIFGLILYCLGFALAVLDETGALFYLHRKSAVNWLNRHGQDLDENTLSSLIIDAIQAVYDQHHPPSPKQIKSPQDGVKGEASPLNPKQVELPQDSVEAKASPVTLKISDENPKKLRRAKAVIWKKKSLPTPTEQITGQPLVKKRSQSAPVKMGDSHSQESHELGGFSSHNLKGLNLHANAFALKNLFKELNQQFQEKLNLTTFQSLGLNEEEAKQIDHFIAQRETKWKKGNFKRRRYNLGYKDLPRTLDVFKENDRLYIMVLCKKKGGLELLGKGCDKKAYLGLDWKTKQRFADLVLQPDPKEIEQKLKELEKENAIARAARGENIAQGFFGLHAYQSKTGEDKIGLYMPLYESRLDKLPALEVELQAQLMGDLLNGLCSLKQSHIEHRDLKGDNVYVSNFKGRPRLFLADFGCSRQEGAKTNDQDKYEILLGNNAYRPPEKIIVKRRRQEIVARFNNRIKLLNKDYENLNDDDSIKKKEETLLQIKANERKALEEVHRVIDETWMQHDTWAIGFLCLGLLTKDKIHYPKEWGIDGHAIEFEKEILKIVYGKQDFSLANLQAYYAEIQQKVDAQLKKVETLLADPLEKKMFGIIQTLLQADPSKRILPQDAFKSLCGIINYH